MLRSSFQQACDHFLSLTLVVVGHVWLLLFPQCCMRFACSALTSATATNPSKQLRSSFVGSKDFLHHISCWPGIKVFPQKESLEQVTSVASVFIVAWGSWAACLELMLWHQCCGCQLVEAASFSELPDRAGVQLSIMSRPGSWTVSEPFPFSVLEPEFSACVFLPGTLVFFSQPRSSKWHL